MVDNPSLPLLCPARWASSGVEVSHLKKHRATGYDPLSDLHTVVPRLKEVLQQSSEQTLEDIDEFLAIVKNPTDFSQNLTVPPSPWFWNSRQKFPPKSSLFASLGLVLSHPRKALPCVVVF